MKEAKFIKQYIKDDELDLEQVIDDYSSYIETIINNMTNILTNEDKEEISSEIIFIIWKNQDKLDLNKQFSSYIAGVTRNVVKEYLKKLKINYDISDYENSLYELDSMEFLNDNEQIIKIEHILEKMKEIDRKVFVDFYYYSKSIKDIAKENKISEFNVKQRLYRIRNKIKKGIK